MDGLLDVGANIRAAFQGRAMKCQDLRQKHQLQS